MDEISFLDRLLQMLEHLTLKHPGDQNLGNVKL